MVTGVGGEEDIYDTLQQMYAILYVDDLPEDEMADCALALHKTIGEDLYLRLWEALEKEPSMRRHWKDTVEHGRRRRESCPRLELPAPD